jgi:hypothetical protein
VQEYLESSRWRRFAYRRARNPIVLFVLAPLYLFMFHQRLVVTRGAGKRERQSVHATNPGSRRDCDPWSLRQQTSEAKLPDDLFKH